MTSVLGPSESDVPRPAPSALDNIEQVAKIFATAAIPIIIAIGGWIIQKTIEDDKQRAATIQQQQQSAIDKDRIALEYVKIAKDILTSAEKDVPQELTTWSWRLLDGVSPIKFDKDDLDRLIERREKIPVDRLTPVEGALSSTAIEQFQKMLCVDATGDLGPSGSQTRTALREFFSGIDLTRNDGAAEMITSPRNLLILRDAQHAFPSCREAGFANAFEVGVFSRTPDPMTGVIKVVVKALEAARLPVPAGLRIANFGPAAIAGLHEAITALRGNYNLSGPPALDRTIYQRILQSASG